MKKKTYAQLLDEYKRVHHRLVEPNQGFDSLAQSLWLAYSIGRKRGYYDVGTYVPKPGDHGGGPHGRGKPAYAFDLRRKGWLGMWGWGWLNARRLAKFYWDNHEALGIDYVIRGRKIISRKYPYWHDLGTGDTSHDWHIHVSGWWPGK